MMNGERVARRDAGRSSELRLSEVLSGLSHALDITEGLARGHAERACVIGMRLADLAGMDEKGRSSLFYALLLKDAGCSSNASRVTSLFGADDAAVKSSRRLIDTTSTARALLHTLRTVAPGGSLGAKARHARQVLRAGRPAAREMFELRCERGAAVVRDIGLGEVAAQAIYDTDERWDGSGYPRGLAGDAISLPGRVVGLAQCAEAFWHHGGPGAACEIARRRRGTWFDPALVDALLTLEHDAGFWQALASPDVSAMEPLDRVLIADDDMLDRVARAFASIVDAKSPYTAHHSEGVTAIADDLAAALRLDGEHRATLRRAALLHDVGKLGVSNRILDKPGPLSGSEWDAVRRHPRWTVEILSRVAAFDEVARIAGAHHERLDGSGYHRGLAAPQLDASSRILAVADVAEALSADRPYRPALDPDAVLGVMGGDGARLDPEVLAALADVLPR